MKRYRILKILFIFSWVYVFATPVYSQELSKNWFNEDPDEDKYAGISSDLAYKKLLAGKESTPVIVAVIDGGTDINHPDLKAHIWVNQGEIPGNGIDDDKNGYVDDVNGWDFIGGKTADIDGENIEMVRMYRSLKAKYDGRSSAGLSKAEKKEYRMYHEFGNQIAKERKNAQAGLNEYGGLKKQLDDMKLSIGKSELSASDVQGYHSDDPEFTKLQAEIVVAMNNGVNFDDFYDDINDGYKQFYGMVNYHYNPDFDPRKIVGDSIGDFSQKYYGNNDVKGPDAEHGTHVAGIIGAVRDNEIGINGIANNVQIMVVRVVPDGDERDKDVANGIRYAVDNGAKIINMSFGKDYSPGRKYVEEAIQYAASKDVLMVHGAGNDHQDIDDKNNFPTPFYESTGQREQAWMEVGAISSSGQVASFSNYGKKDVDLFAPGVRIYSTVPDGKYKFLDGTSMASPTVAGAAAILRSYFPNLTAIQVRTILMDSVIKIPFKTQKPGSKKKVHYSSLCSSGGILNVYRAIQYAQTFP